MLDSDATDDPIHGHQLGRFFHGYYRKPTVIVPLYIFCGDTTCSSARLWPSDIDGAAGSRRKQLRQIVAQIREAWPGVKIYGPRRQRRGFCREPIMAWCEGNGVGYVLGLPQNPAWSP